MPNWCNNTLTISHDDIAMMKRVVKGYNQNRLLNEFIPIPLELREGALSIEELRKERNWEYKKELDLAREQLNQKYFGYKDWYAFCVSEWGTKWDIGRGDWHKTMLMKDIKNKSITMGFDSAWSPPTDAYDKLIEMGFSIRAMYYEGGCCFCGIWEDGEEDFYEITGNSEWVKNNIPKELDEEFCISEGMAVFEQEEEEDAETEES
jgi:hypothetical protein